MSDGDDECIRPLRAACPAKDAFSAISDLKVAVALLSSKDERLTAAVENLSKKLTEYVTNERFRPYAWAVTLIVGSMISGTVAGAFVMFGLK